MSMSHRELSDFSLTNTGDKFNLLEMLFERMPMGVAVLDREFRIRRYNPTWADFSKLYAPESGEPLAPGVYYFDHIPGTERTVQPMYERVLSGETVRQNGVRLESGGIETYWDVVLTPLIERNQVIGILSVSNDATERVLLQQNLEQRVKDRTRELDQRREIAESLSEIIAVLNSSHSLAETLAHITKQANQMLDSQACLIHHIKEDEDFVSIEASFGLPEELKAIPGFPLYSSPKSDNRILHREPVWNSDFRKLPQPTEEGLAKIHPNVRAWRYLTDQYYRAWLAVPLVVAEKVYGSLAFYFESPKNFDQEEIALSQRFADQAALAIENARLYEKAENAAVAAERNRLARDLHDAVTQTLFSASMIADVLPRIWERNPEEGQRRLEELRQLTRGALSEMRTLLVELRPSALADTDLGDLIGHQVNAFIARTRLQVIFEKNCHFNPPPEIKEVLYRITQEAFNNISKHADATKTRIRLDCYPDDVELVIDDDGVGFELESASTEGLGLGIMGERAANVGAQLTINSQIGKGTRLKISWQKANNKEHDDD
jgi:signal transduction histidine kinase